MKMAEKDKMGVKKEGEAVINGDDNGGVAVHPKPFTPGCCDICKGGNVTVGSMVINMLYLGPGSCLDYYKWGMDCRLPVHLCDPLQYYAKVPCGCTDPSKEGEAVESFPTKERGSVCHTEYD